MIHQYKNNGYNIIMDIASGSVHVVDDVVYDVVALMDSWRQEHSCLSKESETSHRPDQVAQDTQPHNPFCPNQTAPKLLSQELRRHIRNKLSPSYQEQEIEEALDEIQQLIHEEELFTKDTYQEYVSDFKKRETVVKALCLHIAHDCNLGCTGFDEF